MPDDLAYCGEKKGLWRRCRRDNTRIIFGWTMRIRVENVGFSKKYRHGDGVFTFIDGRISIVYSEGIIVNDEYLIGKLRFVMDEKGSHELVSLEQHRNPKKEIFGRYSHLPVEKESYCVLNGLPLAWQAININDIICSLSGEDTFKYNSRTCNYSRMLLEAFPGTSFAEVGSSNVGLSSPNSDIDIFIRSNFDNVIDELRKRPKDYGLAINRGSFARDVAQHCSQYGFSEQEAKRVCHAKLSGLEFAGREINFFDATENPILRWLFQPNCSRQIRVNGKIEDDSFAGHCVVSYDVGNGNKYSVGLVRGIFPKGKRYVVRKGDFVQVEGKLVHTDPNVVIAEDLILTQGFSL